MTNSPQSEEERGVSIVTDVCAAVHWHNSLVREPVVHQTEDSLLILATVPGAKNDGDLLLNIEGNRDLAVSVEVSVVSQDRRASNPRKLESISPIQIVFFPLLVHLATGVDDGEIRLEIREIVLALGSYEHVGDKVLLPSHLVDETDLLLTGGVASTKSVKDVQLVLGVHVIDGGLVQIVENLWGDILVYFAPPEVLVGLAANIADNPLVGRGAAGEFSRIHSKRLAVFGPGDLSLLVGLLVFVELLECLVLVNKRRSVNTEGVDSDFRAGSRSLDRP